MRLFCGGSRRFWQNQRANGWRHYAKVLDRLGDGDGAARARAAEERLIAV
jgi:hypothetical protein